MIVSESTSKSLKVPKRNKKISLIPEDFYSGKSIMNYFKKNKNIKKLQVVITKVLKPAIKTSFCLKKQGHKINKNFITLKLHLSLTVILNYQILNRKLKALQKGPNAISYHIKLILENGSKLYQELRKECRLLKFSHFLCEVYIFVSIYIKK